MNEPAEYDVAHPIWLRGRDHGIAEERERIIALLETVDDSNLWRQVAHSPDSYEGFNISDLIALIKGEKQ